MGEVLRRLANVFIRLKLGCSTNMDISKVHNKARMVTLFIKQQILNPYPQYDFDAATTVIGSVLQMVLSRFI
jgi:hypothetical protein